MRTQDRIGARSDAVLVTLTGMRFKGSIYPATDNALPTNTFAASRLALRVRASEPVKTGDLIKDLWGRVFLVADHAPKTWAGAKSTRIHALFEMTEFSIWERSETTIKNPITGQFEARGTKNLGRIWCTLESYTHENSDIGLRIAVDRLRLITGAPIQLGDRVDDRTIKRVISALGVNVAEVE